MAISSRDHEGKNGSTSSLKKAECRPAGSKKLLVLWLRDVQQVYFKKQNVCVFNKEVLTTFAAGSI